jgi:hypothetical protein
MAEQLADLKTPDGSPLPDLPAPSAPPAAKAKERRPKWRSRPGPGAARPMPERPKRRLITGDMMIGGLGVALGLGCALFPWYVFLNQEQFGIRGLRLAGTEAAYIANPNYQPTRIGAPYKLQDRSDALDMFPTGTVPAEEDKSAAGDHSDQPFPGDKASNARFNLVQVANGRAMIEDEDGLWVVKVGSPLPDDSRVASIEERDGRWVLVTSDDKVVWMPR